MLNIYTVILTIIILFSLNMIWKAFSTHRYLEKKVIEGFAGTSTTAPAQTVEVIDATSLGNLSSIYDKNKATFPAVDTTGDVTIGKDGSSNLTVNGNITGKDLTVQGTLSGAGITNFKNSLNSFSSDVTIGTTDISRNLTVNGNLKLAGNIVKGSQPTSGITSTDLGLYSYSPGGWIRYVSTKTDANTGGRHVWFARNASDNAKGNQELVSIESDGRLIANNNVSINSMGDFGGVLTLKGGKTGAKESAYIDFRNAENNNRQGYIQGKPEGGLGFIADKGEFTFNKPVSVTGDAKVFGELHFGKGQVDSPLIKLRSTPSTAGGWVRLLPINAENTANGDNTWGPAFASKFCYANDGFEVRRGGLYKGTTSTLEGFPTGDMDLGIYGNAQDQFVRYVTNNGRHVWYTDGRYGTTPKMQLEPKGRLTIDGNKELCLGKVCINEGILKNIITMGHNLTTNSINVAASVALNQW
jgi:hypothetical protein